MNEEYNDVFNYSFNSHIGDVKEFMVLANQTTSNIIRTPSTQERILRAKLIFEESMETIQALGVGVQVGPNNDWVFVDIGEANYNPEDVLDGIADIFVVTTGAGICCGLTDVIEEAIDRVCQNNLSKVDGQHSFREDGKLLKSPNYKPVVLDDLIERVS
jgi:predicted HAD superfamily Cof-like phosphohydrolase